MTAASLVDQYFAILDEVGVENFHNPSLDALRMRMTDRELLAVQARLEAEAKAALQERTNLSDTAKSDLGRTTTRSHSNHRLGLMAIGLRGWAGWPRPLQGANFRAPSI